MVPDDDNILTSYGMVYMKNLGARMKQRMSSLKYVGSANIKASVFTTNITRTIQSANEYLKGFYGFWPKPTVRPLDGDNDYLLKFPDLCAKYLKVKATLNVYFSCDVICLK